MAPEQWAGQPASPASDIYAATAVFFECLTGRPPFEGSIRHLREQHEHRPVPSIEVAEPFRDLLERGMAKQPTERPPDAAAFVFELENAAAAAAGPDWEARGRSQLKERAAALLLLLGGGLAGSSGTAAATTWLGRHKAAAIMTAGAVVVAAVVAGGVAVASNGRHQHQPPPGNGITVVSQPQVGASATVAPPTAAVPCAAPATFTYTATLTVSQPGPLSYRWIYSSGAAGPVHTLQASHAGPYQVSGGVVKASTTGSGWAQVQVTSPLTVTSNKAAYQLSCVTPAVTIALGSQPASPHAVQCGTAPPTFTISGQIKSSVAGQLSYHWTRSNGTYTASQTVSVSAGQTVNVTDSVTAASDTYSGSDALDVTSPVAQSQTIPITVTCTAPPPPVHVSSVTVSNPVPDPSDTCQLQSNVTASFTVSVQATSTSAVTLKWATWLTSSQSLTEPPGALTSSRVLVGQTTYVVTIDASFGPITCGTYFDVKVTATGSDNQPTSATGSTAYAF
jgi:serine/threonine-protein kinase